MTVPLQKIEKNHAFVASAGTGKTEQLALRFISLLDYTSPDATLAVTFTKNAAGEILGRIIKLLVNAYFDDESRKRLEEELKETFPLSKEKLQVWLLDIINNLPRLSISTLDSFFYQIIACYPLELGLNSAPDIAQGYVDKKIQKKVLKQLFARAKSAPEFLVSLKDLMIALTSGKESGKLSEKISETAGKVYETFLNSPESAWEGLKVKPKIEELPDWDFMVERLKPMYGKSNKNFDNYIKSLKNKEFKTAITKGPVKSFLAGKEKYSALKFDNDEIKKLLQSIADYATTRIIDEANGKTKAYFDLMKLYDAIFKAEKQNENMINYSDIYKLLIGSIASETNNRGLHVYYRLDSKINHFLIDEFQDTNRDQWQAMRPLVTEAIQDTDENRTYFMVGDMKQSIYGWRGGDPRLFSRICDNYEIKTDTLIKSYRSGQNILDAINHIFSSPAVNEWAEEFKFENHISAVDEQGYFEFIETGDEETDEETSLLAAVHKLIEKIKPTERGLSTAILFRKSKTLNAMADYLKSKGLDCYIKGTNPLFQKSSVRRFLSLFELMENPDNKVAFYHLTESGSYLRGLIPDSRVKFHEFLKGLREKLIYDSYTNVIMEIIQKISFDNNSARDYLYQLIEIAEQYEPLKTANPKDFITYVEQTDIATPETGNGIILSTIHGSKGLGFDIVILPELSGKPNHPDIYTKKRKINILGDELEIETVTTLSNKDFIPAIPELKIIREQYQKDFENELLNLLYVALTRAKKGLYLLTGTRKISKDNKINKFLDVLIPALENITDDENKIIAEFGNPDWYEKHPIINQEEKQIRKQVKEIVLKNKVPRFRPYQIPSSLHDTKMNNRVSVFSAGSRRGKAKGTIIHALFERIEWLSSDITKENLYFNYLKVARQVSRGFDDKFYELTVNEFFEILQKKQIRDILTKPEENCEVKNELRFAAIINEKLTNGTFDRVVFFPDSSSPEKVEIYDYKTDAVITEEEIKLAVENYTPQVNCYKKAILNGCNLDAEKVKARLVFTTPDKIIDA